MSKWKGCLFFVAVTLLPTISWAEEAHHGVDPHAIPWPTIISQAFNFFLLIAILVWVSRKAVIKMFSERRQVYLDLVQRADSAKNEAEKNRREIAGRLKTMEDSSQQSLVQAREEAQELQKRIVGEAQELAVKVREESERATKFELERAKQELRAEVLATAVDAARRAMQEKVSGAEQKKLQDEFVEKIQVVR